MPYTYSTAELAAINTAYTNGDWQAAYAAALAPLSSTTHAAEYAWLNGAKQMNAGTGDYSTFIRNYTAEQYRIRYDETLSTSDMQDASDEVARAVMTEILATGALPTISEIGAIDAETVGNYLFDGAKGAWSGSALFTMLGTNEFLQSNILGANDPAYEIAAMLQSGFSNINSLSAFTSTLQALCQSINPNITQFGSATAAWSAISAKLVDLYDLSLIQMAGYGYVIDQTDNGGTLAGTSADDWMVGGSGDDTFLGSDDVDILEGGAGSDTADYSAGPSTAGLTVSIDASDMGTAVRRYYEVENDTFGTTDFLYSIETIIGTAKADTIKFTGTIPNINLTVHMEDQSNGHDLIDLSAVTMKVEFYYDSFVDSDIFITGVDAITGGSNDDILALGAGDNILRGGGGDDILIGGAGADTLDGGADWDVAAYWHSDVAVTINTRNSALGAGDAKDDVYISIDSFHGTDYNDVFVDNANYVEMFFGGAGNDTFYVGVMEDTFYGEDEADKYILTMESFYASTPSGSGWKDPLSGTVPRVTIADFGAGDHFDFSQIDAFAASQST